MILPEKLRLCLQEGKAELRARKNKQIHFITPTETYAVTKREETSTKYMCTFKGCDALNMPYRADRKEAIITNEFKNVYLVERVVPNYGDFYDKKLKPMAYDGIGPLK